MDNFGKLPLASRTGNGPGNKNSMAAARQLRASGQQSRQITLCAKIVALRPGKTCRELAELSLRPDRIYHILARRLCEAERQGYVQRGLNRECKITGRYVTTWWPKVNPTSGELNQPPY